MFFKREKAKVLGFNELMDQLPGSGYSVESSRDGLVRVSKGNFAALLKDDGGKPSFADLGLLLGSEVAVLTDIGFQKIFLAPSGKRTPALAEHLHALHNFKEDLSSALGVTSLYNEGLGTTNEKHLYDRVQNRDRGNSKRPWERN